MTHVFPERLQAYVVQSAADLMMGRQTIVVPSGEKDGLGEAWPLAVIGINSPELDGSVLLCCPPEFVKATHPNPASVATPAKLHDWLGEMANMVAGRLKQLVHPHGIKLKVRPPSIETAAKSFVASFTERHPTQAFWFECEGQPLCLMLCATLSQHADFDAEPDPLLVTAQAGDVIID